MNVRIVVMHADGPDQKTHFTHSVVVTCAGLKSPIGRAVERTEIVLDEQFLILLRVDQAYRGVDGRDLVLQRIVMSQLERLREMKHGRDVGDVVGLEVLYIASAANHQTSKCSLTMLLIRKLGCTHGSNSRKRVGLTFSIVDNPSV